MAGTPDFIIKAHDLLPSFRVPLTVGGLPLDLTNALSADFIMKSSTGVVVINRAGVIETPKTLGIFRYDWIAGDTDNVGEYTCESEIHWPGTKPQTAPTNAYWVVQIVADLDGAA